MVPVNFDFFHSKNNQSDTYREKIKVTNSSNIRVCVKGEGEGGAVEIRRLGSNLLLYWFHRNQWRKKTQQVLLLPYKISGCSS